VGNAGSSLWRQSRRTGSRGGDGGAWWRQTEGAGKERKGRAVIHGSGGQVIEPNTPMPNRAGLKKTDSFFRSL
jgi:hypothetical protein